MQTTQMLLSLMLASSPPAETAASDRMTEIAEGITRASAMWPLWSGASGKTATATLLLAIAIHESGLRADVQRCERGGDGGRSKGLFQLMHPVATAPFDLEELCASAGIQAAAALRVLWRHRDVCPSCAPRRWITGYASGDGARDSDAAREIASLWVSLSRKAGLLVSPDAVRRSPWIAPAPRRGRAPDS
jgi:hypothetical protein